MPREFLLSVLALGCAAVAGVGCIDTLVALYQTSLALAARLGSERWLLEVAVGPRIAHSDTDGGKR